MSKCQSRSRDTYNSSYDYGARDQIDTTPNQNNEGQAAPGCLVGEEEGTAQTTVEPLHNMSEHKGASL